MPAERAIPRPRRHRLRLRPDVAWQSRWAPPAPPSAPPGPEEPAIPAWQFAVFLSATSVFGNVTTQVCVFLLYVIGGVLLGPDYGIAEWQRDLPLFLHIFLIGLVGFPLVVGVCSLVGVALRRLVPEDTGSPG